MCSLHRQGNIFILTLTGHDEHRLNPTLIDSIKQTLTQIKSQISAEPNSSFALITTAEGKFFSNGYDLNWAKTSPDRIRLMTSKFRSLISELLSLPMPTIAAVSGHASAGGFILALSHDYILMRKDRGFLYMSELDINLVIPAWFSVLIKCKVGAPTARREVILTASKITAEKGVAMGIVDSAHDGAEETVKAAVKLGNELVKRKWNGHVYGENRVAMMVDVLAAIKELETEEDALKVISRL